jgi:hypothetical protein
MLKFFFGDIQFTNMLSNDTIFILISRFLHFLRQVFTHIWILLSNDNIIFNCHFFVPLETKLLDMNNFISFFDFVLKSLDFSFFHFFNLDVTLFVRFLEMFEFSLELFEFTCDLLESCGKKIISFLGTLLSFMVFDF